MNVRNLLLPYVLSLALALSVLAMTLPWWSVRTSNEAGTVLGGSANIDLELWQSVSVVLTVNRTRSVVLGFSDLVSNGQDLSDLSNVLNVTLILAIIGVAFTAVLWVLSIFSLLRGSSFVSGRLFYLLVVVDGILLLAAPLNMYSSLYPPVTKLDTFSTFSFPSSWIQIYPRDITSFVGSLSIPGNIGFPKYLVGYSFWSWGPGAGWFFSFTSALLLFSVAILSRRVAPRKSV